MTRRARPIIGALAALVLAAGAFAVGRIVAREVTAQEDATGADGVTVEGEIADGDAREAGPPATLAAPHGDQVTPQSGRSPGDTPLDRNVVLINTDDLPASLFHHLPKTRRLLAPSGLEFTNHIVSTPTCCPSRASLFSGLEPQHHGVINNVQPFGSATRFNDELSFVTSLQDAGYATAHYGKYLNGFRAAQPLVPPGWDDFHALVFNDGPTRGYFDYTILENGETVRYGDEPEEYSTRLLGHRTIEFIEAKAGNEPFFVYYAPFAPHTPATAESVHNGTLDSLAVPRPPNFNEADVSDKPRWVRETDLLTPARVAEIDQQYRDMAESLATVDDLVEEIVAALEQAGELDRTLIVFTSDNGLLLGAHRQTAKECPYEECIRTPLLIHHPEATVVGESSALVSPADYAPTILDWLGVAPGWTMDGVSLLGAFTDPDWSARDAKLIQVLGRPFNQQRNFIGLRTETHTYVTYRNGDRELYDLIDDPHQLDNLIDDPTQADVAADLARTLDGRRGETDLGLTFEVEHPDVARGGVIDLDFTVTNYGSRMANHVYVVHTAPDAFRPIDCSGTAEARCYTFGDRQQVRFMAIDPGATVRGTIRLKVREAAFAEAVTFEAALEGFNTVDLNPDDDVARFELIIT
ncbi:MAG: sulfatase [Actinomycetota bacterium]